MSLSRDGEGQEEDGDRAEEVDSPVPGIPGEEGMIPNRTGKQIHQNHHVSFNTSSPSLFSLCQYPQCCCYWGRQRQDKSKNPKVKQKVIMLPTQYSKELISDWSLGDMISVSYWSFSDQRPNQRVSASLPIVKVSVIIEKWWELITLCTNEWMLHKHSGPQSNTNTLMLGVKLRF